MYCNRCARELEEDRLYTGAYISDFEIICRDCWINGWREKASVH